MKAAISAHYSTDKHREGVGVDIVLERYKKHLQRSKK